MPATPDSTDTIRLSITRTTGGVQFQIFTPLFEQFFSQLASAGTTNGRPRQVADGFFGTQSLYGIQPREQESLCIPGTFYEPNSGRLVDNNGAINLTLLTAVGSGNAPGVTFTVRTVMSKTQQRQLTEGLNRAIRSLYLEFMRPEINTIEFDIRQFTQ